jgi:hypothetical protein
VKLPRCARCRRTLGPNNANGKVCAGCRDWTQCVVCGGTRPPHTTWCPQCRAGHALASAVWHDNPGVRPPEALLEERLVLYERLAALGLPLRPGSTAECGRGDGEDVAEPVGLREVQCVLPRPAGRGLF